MTTKLALIAVLLSAVVAAAVAANPKPAACNSGFCPPGPCFSSSYCGKCSCMRSGPEAGVCVSFN